MKTYFSILAALMLSACSSTGIVPVGGNTYMIATKSAQVGFGPPIAAEAHIYRRADAFCAQEQKTVKTLHLQVIDSGLARPGSVSLRFRCVAKK